MVVAQCEADMAQAGAKWQQGGNDVDSHIDGDQRNYDSTMAMANGGDRRQKKVITSMLAPAKPSLSSDAMMKVSEGLNGEEGDGEARVDD